MTNVFAAVGSRRGDPTVLLLLGTDGLHYAQPLPDGSPVPVDPSDGEWAFDGAEPEPDDIAT